MLMSSTNYKMKNEIFIVLIKLHYTHIIIILAVAVIKYNIDRYIFLINLYLLVRYINCGDVH